MTLIIVFQLKDLVKNLTIAKDNNSEEKFAIKNNKIMKLCLGIKEKLD